MLDVACDILIPAARPDAIRADNVGRLKARLIVAGANIPATADAEAALGERGLLLVPDLIANAGGVICAAVEVHGGTKAAAFQAIEENIRGNTAALLDEVKASGLPPRQVAVARACRRVRAAMGLRRPAF